MQRPPSRGHLHGIAQLRVDLQQCLKLGSVQPIQFHRGAAAHGGVSFAALQQGGRSNPVVLRALAAAYAETGDFDEAVAWQEKALAARGAEVIAPENFYDGREVADVVREAIRHGDLAVAKQRYTPALYDLALYWSVRQQMCEMVVWLAAQQPIDWSRTLEPDPLDSNADIFAAYPLYEVPFAFSDGNHCDIQLIDYIVANVPNLPADALNRIAVHVAGFNFLPGTLETLGALAKWGADFDAEVPLHRGSTELYKALDQALLNECVQHLDFLLDQGATMAEDDYTVAEYIKTYFSGDLKREAQAILKARSH